MKWRQMNNAFSQTEPLLLVKKRLGKDGCWSLMLLEEHLAKHMDVETEPKKAMTPQDWARILQIKSTRLQHYLRVFRDVGLISSRTTRHFIEIKMSNLNDRKDNHTRNLQATSKSLASPSTDRSEDQSFKSTDHDGDPQYRKRVTRAIKSHDVLSDLDTRPLAEAMSKNHERLWYAVACIHKARTKSHEMRDGWLVNRMDRDDWEFTIDEEEAASAIVRAWRNDSPVKSESAKNPDLPPSVTEEFSITEEERRRMETLAQKTKELLADTTTRKRKEGHA